MLRGPEEVDPAQETDEERRVAERREGTADIRHKYDEEHDGVRSMAALGIRPQQWADQDHGGSCGADETRHRRAEREQARIDERRAAEIAGDQNPAGYHVKR